MSFWESCKALVTGGCGFLGSYLVEGLVAAGADVTAVDNLESGSLDNISSVADRVRFIETDLVDLESCLRVSRDADVVMNLVGRTRGVGYGSDHPGEMLFHNTVTHLNMLEAARANGVERFLVVSSSCVYPDDAPAPTPELPVMTGDPEGANEGYGWAKRVAELQAQYYRREYGLKVTICRPFNPYGGRYLWRGERDSHVVPTLVKKIMDGQDPLIVWGSGKQRRNFLHARDAVKYMMLLTERHASSEPVNIGFEEDISIAQLVSLICEVAGRSPEVRFDTSKPEGRFRKCADSTLLREIAGDYKPTVPLREGIQEMVSWYHRTFER
jgi:nucleoside-diphosphate-sugar epimerase